MKKECIEVLNKLTDKNNIFFTDRGNSSIKLALKLVKQPEPALAEFRLYYNKATGEPLFYTMENEEGDYIRVTKEQFAECRYDIIVKDGKITRPKHIAIGKLVPSDTGFGTLKRDMSIVADEVYWSMKTYDD